MSEQVVVINNGSLRTRVGLSGDDEPSATFRNNAYDSLPHKNEHPQCLIERGLVTNWEEIEKIWQHCFKQLGLESSAQPVLLTDSIIGATENREKMATLMFEKFDAPALNISLTSALSTFPCMCNTGVIVESGDDITQSVPIIEGKIVKDAITSTSVAGRDITEAFSKLLEKEGFTYDNETIRAAKERLCTIALFYENEMENRNSRTCSYELPDGKILEIAAWQQYLSGEAIFKPNLIGINSPGLAENTKNAIEKCDQGIQRELYEYVYVVGGNSKLGGFALAERLQKELADLSRARRIKVRTPPHVQDRSNTAWVGGSYFSSMSNFQESVVTKQEYDEHGIHFIHKKF
jgi:actin-related protein